MIEFKPTALYSKRDLEAALSEVPLDPDYFLARVKPTKRLKSLWLGSDLIAALEALPPMNEGPEAVQVEAKNGGGRRKKKATSEGSLIGGVFSRSALGLSSREGCHHDRSSLPSHAANHPRKGGD